MTQTQPVTPTPPASFQTQHDPRTRLGATPLPGGAGTRFRLWTSTARTVAVRVNGTEHVMTSLGGGIYELELPVGPGARYLFVLDGVPTPDPYARFLPDGVHGEAEVVDFGTFDWTDADWHGIKLADCVFYEVHVGTFTPEGTYRAAAEKLPYLKELGVTAIQVMPLAAFDGQRGWGYDGAAFYAPYAPYGRPEDLMALVDAAHRLGLGVFLDVVYNHFGPSGNYLSSYAPSYFTDRFSSAWGMGLDYAEPHMRRYVTGNARMWLRDYHFDGLRLDATPYMTDDSETHILTELAQEIHELGGTHLLLAEDHRNLPDLVTVNHLDGIWTDDFHHETRVTLTGEQEGYYAGYRGGAEALAYTIRRGWRYEGQFWAVKGEEHERGHPSDALEAPNFVYCIQNHDQIGNRPLGERLHQSDGVTLHEYRGAAAAADAADDPAAVSGPGMGCQHAVSVFQRPRGRVGTGRIRRPQKGIRGLQRLQRRGRARPAGRADFPQLQTELGRARGRRTRPHPAPVPRPAAAAARGPGAAQPPAREPDHRPRRRRAVGPYRDRRRRAGAAVEPGPGHAGRRRGQVALHRA